jgi:AAA+ superfamily predicted ATPase
MKSKILISIALSLLIVNCHAGFFEGMDSWNNRNNQDLMNAMRYVLHPLFPRHIAEPEPIADTPSREEEGGEVANLHFNHQMGLGARFSSHFKWKGNMDIDTILFYLNSPDKFDGLEMPRGLLLYGPPGTGKTTLARILAGESGLDFISLSGSDFSQKYYGEGSKAVHRLFKYARDLSKPVILFIDEIDSVGVKRTEDSNQEDRKVLNSLLTELTDEQNNNIFVVGATNHLDLLDRAFQRRFNYAVKIDVPDEEQRKQIFMFYLAGKQHALNCPKCKELDCTCSDSPLKRIVKKMETNGCSGLSKPFSGSDIKELINRAAIYARIPGVNTIFEQHINTAYDTIKEKHQVDWTVFGWDGALYRGVWRAPVIGDAATWVYNLRKPDKE